MSIAAASEAPARSPSAQDYWHDLAEGLALWRVWTHLAWRELRLEYRKSRLGPLWVTISIGVLIAAKGALFSLLMGTEIKPYLMWLGSGFLVWLFVSSVIGYGVGAFQANRGQMLNIRLPYSFYVLKSVTRQALNFLHHAPILIVLSLYTQSTVPWTAIYALPGFLICSVTALWVMYLLAMLAVRFPILTHLVPTILPVLFLFTPILWEVRNLGDYAWVADVNPLFHYVQLIRAPLMGELPSSLALSATSGLLVLGFALTALLHNMWRKRLLISV